MLWLLQSWKALLAPSLQVLWGDHKISVLLPHGTEPITALHSFRWVGGRVGGWMGGWVVVEVGGWVGGWVGGGWGGGWVGGWVRGDGGWAGGTCRKGRLQGGFLMGCLSAGGGGMGEGWQAQKGPCMVPDPLSTQYSIF